ncbi:MAG: HAD-IA family hydrolase [Algisphaera sp.]
MQSLLPNVPADDSSAGLIDLVVFDLGRVLMQITDDLDQAAQRAGRAGLPGFTGDLSAHTRRGGNPKVVELLSAYEIGQVTTADYLEGIAAQVGVTPQDIAAVHDAVIVQTFAGWPALLDRLDTAAVLTACLSNTNAAHWATMHDPKDVCFAHLRRLNFCFASHQIGRAKPSADAYHYVESATRVPAERILFFDDLDENIAAAKARGWQAICVPRMDNPMSWIEGKLIERGVLA